MRTDPEPEPEPTPTPMPKGERDTLWYVNEGRRLRGAEPLEKLPSFYEPVEEPDWPL